MRRLLVACLILIVTVLGAWYIAVPDSLLVGLMERSLGNGDFRAEVSGMKKGFLYSFGADKVTLTKAGKTLVAADEVQFRIRPLSFLLLKLTVAIHGSLAGGVFDGMIVASRKERAADVTLSNARIQDIPFFSLAGLNGAGGLSGECSFRNGAGGVKFALKDLNVKTATFTGVSVPLEMFYAGKGALTVKGNTVNLDSFTLEGDGIYARLKGGIRGDVADLTMELMPEKSFEERSPIMMLLRNYRVSPGYYAIPIKSRIEL